MLECRLRNPLFFGVKCEPRKKEEGMRILSLLAVGVFISGCAGQNAATNASDAKIKIETSQMFVTVKNDSGMAINDVTVAILPMGRSTLFNKFVGRLEN